VPLTDDLEAREKACDYIEAVAGPGAVKDLDPRQNYLYQFTAVELAAVLAAVEERCR
jgi:hypothetical protein